MPRLTRRAENRHVSQRLRRAGRARSVSGECWTETQRVADSPFKFAAPAVTGSTVARVRITWPIRTSGALRHAVAKGRCVDVRRREAGGVGHLVASSTTYHSGQLFSLAQFHGSFMIVQAWRRGRAACRRRARVLWTVTTALPRASLAMPTSTSSPRVDAPPAGVGVGVEERRADEVAVEVAAGRGAVRPLVAEQCHNLPVGPSQRFVAQGRAVGGDVDAARARQPRCPCRRRRPRAGRSRGQTTRGRSRRFSRRSRRGRAALIVPWRRAVSVKRMAPLRM